MVGQESGAAEELRALGLRTVPVTVIGDKIIVGFRPNELSQALGLGVTFDAPSSTATLLFLGQVLKAVQQTVRQIPDDRLSYVAGIGRPPMSQFTHHMFSVVLRTMEDLDIGVFPLEKQSAQEAHVPQYESFRQVADYGEKVIQTLRRWTLKHDAAMLNRKFLPGSGLRSGAEMLDLAAGHVTQHLRQLYHILENVFEIMPQNRLQDSDIPPHYILTILW